MSHHLFLDHTLQLAKTRRGYCAPNPSVGAVVVRDGNVISEGLHESPGAPHAEVMALKKLCYPIENATLYVSLEPCSHWGKTPPCFDEIVRSGIKSVVYAYSDPNPLTKKVNIIKAFQEKGIKCIQVEIEEISHFYESYEYWTLNKKPFVTAKVAQSLDGKISGPKGEPIQITSDHLAALTHRNRLTSDYILTTAETVINDNPKLNARISDISYPKNIAIIDSDLRLTGKEQLFELAENVVVFHKEGADFNPQNTHDINYIPIPSIDNRLDLSNVLTILGEKGAHDVWVEVGGACLTTLLTTQLINRLYLYIAPLFLGENKKSLYQSTNSFQVDKQAGISWQQVGREMIGCFDLKGQ